MKQTGWSKPTLFSTKYPAHMGAGPGQTQLPHPRPGTSRTENSQPLRLFSLKKVYSRVKLNMPVSKTPDLLFLTICAELLSLG